MGVVDQQVRERSWRKVLEVGARIIERRPGWAAVLEPAQRHRDAVLAELPLDAHRAGAGKLEPTLAETQLDRVAIAALNRRIDAPGPCPQRADPALVEVGRPPLKRTGRSQTLDDRLAENTRKLWHDDLSVRGTPEGSSVQMCSCRDASWLKGRSRLYMSTSMRAVLCESTAMLAAPARAQGRASISATRRHVLTGVSSNHSS